MGGSCAVGGPLPDASSRAAGQKVTAEAQLDPTKRFVGSAPDGAGHAIQAVQQFGIHHGDLVDDQQLAVAPALTGGRVGQDAVQQLRGGGSAVTDTGKGVQGGPTHIAGRHARGAAHVHPVGVPGSLADPGEAVGLADAGRTSQANIATIAQGRKDTGLLVGEEGLQPAIAVARSLQARWFTHVCEASHGTILANMLTKLDNFLHDDSPRPEFF